MKSTTAQALTVTNGTLAKLTSGCSPPSHISLPPCLSVPTLSLSEPVARQILM